VKPCCDKQRHVTSHIICLMLGPSEGETPDNQGDVSIVSCDHMCRKLDPVSEGSCICMHRCNNIT
jgi:hypothetical protein